MSAKETFISEPSESRVTLRNVDWETYVQLAGQRDGSAPRLTYSRGMLELMSPKRQHETIGRLIGRMIEVFSEEKDIEIISLASTTIRRQSLGRGFEAAEPYYVSHAVQMLEKEEPDFEFDPVPDLVVEVELTRCTFDKMELFASLKVSEVWRYRSGGLDIMRLVDNNYEVVSSSVELPGLHASIVNEFLNNRIEIGETSLIKQFRRKIKGQD